MGYFPPFRVLVYGVFSAVPPFCVLGSPSAFASQTHGSHKTEFEMKTKERERFNQIVPKKKSCGTLHYFCLETKADHWGDWQRYFCLVTRPECGLLLSGDDETHKWSALAWQSNGVFLLPFGRGPACSDFALQTHGSHKSKFVMIEEVGLFVTQFVTISD